MQISFCSVPDVSDVMNDLDHQSLYIRAFENAGDENSAFLLIKKALSYPIQKKMNAGTFHGCVSGEDVLQDIYLTAIDKFRVYRPIFVKIYHEGETFDLASAIREHLITPEMANAISAQISVLNDTIGTPDCPYSDSDSLQKSLDAVVSSIPDTFVRVANITPWSYMSHDINHAFAQNQSLMTGISTNDRARAKRINEGKEIPKLDSTKRTLDAILQNGTPYSYDAMREQRKETGNEDSIDLHVSSIYTGSSENESAEDRFIEKQENLCTEAILEYKKAVKDNGLQKRVAQKLFWKKQVEHIIEGSIDLSISEIIEMTKKILNEYDPNAKC